MEILRILDKFRVNKFKETNLKTLILRLGSIFHLLQLGNWKESLANSRT